MKAVRDLVLAIGAGIAVHRVLRARRRSERRARGGGRAARWLRRAFRVADHPRRGRPT
jgi:hypothetical protein